MSKKKKGMKKNEKIVILVLVIIVIALIIVQIVRNNSNNSEGTTVTSNSSNSETESSDDEEEETIVKENDPNSIINIDKEKTLDWLTVEKIELTESEGVTQILATVVSTSKSTQSGFVATLTLLDGDGNTLIELNPYIPRLQPDERAEISLSATFDYAQAYDYTITKES